jgi:hypothetical protein
VFTIYFIYLHNDVFSSSSAEITHTEARNWAALVVLEFELPLPAMADLSKERRKSKSKSMAVCKAWSRRRLGCSL